jgi:hypothetical protein
MVDARDLSVCMRFFKNADPRVYERFIRTLDAYVQEVTVAVTEAPVTEIMNAQGRAQQARKFFQLFTELPANTDPRPSA